VTAGDFDLGLGDFSDLDDDCEVTIDGEEWRVWTENSLWFVNSEAFMRCPLIEAPRHCLDTLEGPLPDGAWTPHTGSIRTVKWPDGVQLRIVPSGRPEGSQGLVTGMVQKVVRALR